jgi:NAD(P)-dependent dehydrogenase (short-subunit alcohol dehydrogenase family)
MTTALVSGANKGIGRAIAAGLAARGFTVYAGVRNPAAAEEITAADIQAAAEP